MAKKTKTETETMCKICSFYNPETEDQEASCDFHEKSFSELEIGMGGCSNGIWDLEINQVKKMENTQNEEIAIQWLTRLNQTDPETMRKLIAVEIQEYQKDFGHALMFSSNIKETITQSVQDLMKIIDPYLPPIFKKDGPLYSDDTPRVMDQDIAKWLFLRIIRKNCKNCNSLLSPKKIFHYDHKSGWNIKGYGKKQWVFIACGKCGHQWSLSKLGVSNLG